MSISHEMAQPGPVAVAQRSWSSLRRVAANVSWLSLNQALSYLLPLVTTPILTHAFGAQGYGVYSTALAYGGYATLLVTYGFNYYGPRAVALCHDDPGALRRLSSAILAAQATIGVAAMAVLGMCLAFLHVQGPDMAIYLVIAAQAAVAAATPMWLFVGLQDLRNVSLAQCAGRLAVFALTVALVRRPEDLLLLSIGMLAVAVAVLGYTLSEGWRLLGRRLVIRMSQLRRVFAEAAPFFWSSVAVGVYASSSTVIVNALLGASPAGHFALADKLRIAAVSLTVPLTQAVYPLFNQRAASAETADDRHLRRMFVGAMLAFGVGSSAAMFWFAPEIIHLLGGHSFGSAAGLLRIMAPAPLLLGLSNILGRQTLIPWGHIRLFTRITFAAAAVGLVSIALLTVGFGVAGAAWSGLLVETFVTVALAVGAARHGLLRRAFGIA